MKKIKLEELLNFWKQYYNNLYLDDKIKEQILYKFWVKRKKKLFGRFYYYVWSVVFVIFLIVLLNFLFLWKRISQNLVDNTNVSVEEKYNNDVEYNNVVVRNWFLNQQSTYNLDDIPWSVESVTNSSSNYNLVFIVLVVIFILGIIVYVIKRKRK